MAMYFVPIIIGVLAAISFLLPSYIISGWVAVYLSPSFSFSDIPDLSGKIALVTGANTGIGFVTARELAKKGARVIATSRSTIKGEYARKSINDILEKDSSKGSVEFLQLDLSSLANVKDFTDKILETVSKLDILILNAGVMIPPFERTVDGFELTIATNHLGHFLLVKRLLSLISKSRTRIVHVSSLAHWFSYSGGIDVRTFTDQSLYNKYKSYGQSKLANVLFSNELARRLEGTGATSNALHPGSIITDLQRHINQSMTLVNVTDSFLLQSTYQFVNYIMQKNILMTTDQGAYNQLYVATSPNLTNVTGQYFNPVGILATPSSNALNVTLQRKLWEVSEELTKAYQ